MAGMVGMAGWRCAWAFVWLLAWCDWQSRHGSGNHNAGCWGTAGVGGGAEWLTT